MTPDEIAAVPLLRMSFDEWMAFCYAKPAHDSLNQSLLSVAVVREAKLLDRIKQLEDQLAARSMTSSATKGRD